ncbi:uncharacterized protein TNCV_2866501 [Trichonephila clavipes]|nr:uncharacterized protein TNCV_2866501 [Trichonephila clavipes]
MVGFEWRENAEQLRYAPPHWSCSGYYGLRRYWISLSHSSSTHFRYFKQLALHLRGVGASCPSLPSGSYYPYGLNVIWKGESVLLTFKQKSEDSLYIPNFDKSIDNSNNIRLARISRAKRRKRVTRDMSTLKNSMLELAVKFDDNYNTGLIKSFMFGMCV